MLIDFFTPPLSRQFQADEYFDLENPRDLIWLDSPQLTLENCNDLIVIDEIQRKPVQFPLLRYLADYLNDLKQSQLDNLTFALLTVSLQASNPALAHSMEVLRYSV